MAASQTRTRVAPNLYQRGDGVFVAGLTIAGKWRMKTLAARTKREAKLELLSLQAEAAQARAEADLASPAPAASFAELSTDFLAYFRALVEARERSPRTLGHYEWVIEDYLLPAWAEREVQAIAPDDVVLLSQTLRERGRGPSVLKAVEETASRLCSFAVRRGHIDSNPVSKLERGERARVTAEDRRVLSHAEIARLLASVDGVLETAIIAVPLYAGLRQGEVLGLRWCDVDFDHGLLRLRHQLQRPGRGRPAMLAPLKSHAPRDVVLVPQLAARLRELRATSLHVRDEGFVFAAAEGSPLHYSRMNRILKRVARDASVEALSAHVFRRTYATHLIIDQRLDAVRVQRQLGHSRPSVTLDRYSFLFEQARHADDLRMQIAGSEFAALLAPGPKPLPAKPQESRQLGVSAQVMA